VLFFITLPAMAGLIALREPIVSTLFYRGRFDYGATVGTSDALLFYPVGIWAMVGVRVLAAAFYSMQDTRRPVKAAVFALTANVILSFVLMWPLKHKGLALANALASMLNFAVLFYFLRQKLKRVEGRRIAASFAKSLFASVLMGAGGYLFLRSGLWQQKGMAMEKAWRLSAGIGLSAGIYLIVCYFLRSEELGYVVKAVRKRVGGQHK
jgi:putative peptidoglycan lipid II flippase